MKKIDKNNTFNEARIFFCPQCTKQRMKRPIDYTPIKDFEVISKKKVYKDVCDKCFIKNIIFVGENKAQEILNAEKEGKPIDLESML